MNKKSSDKLYDYLMLLKPVADPNLSVEQALAIGFEVPQGEKSLIMRKFSDMLSLPTKIRSDILFGTSYSIVDDLMWWEESFSQIFLSIDMSGYWSNLNGQLSKSILAGVKASGAGISKTFTSKKPVEQEKIDLIIEHAQQLLSEVRNGDIDQDVKRVISKYLLMIISALQEYEDFGVEAALETIERITGSFELRFISEKINWNDKIMRDFRNVVNSVAIICTLTGVSVPQLIMMSSDAQDKVCDSAIIEEYIEKDKLPIEIEPLAALPRGSQELDDIIEEVDD